MAIHTAVTAMNTTAVQMIKLASHFKWVQYRGMRSHFALQILISLACGSMLFIKVCTRRRT
jgi:hypothetical protein